MRRRRARRADLGRWNRRAEADARLRACAERTAGSVLDELATAQALSASSLRAADCGALARPRGRRSPVSPPIGSARSPGVTGSH
ncbi:DUF6986 family protein [Umezawaea beigongshangensis]|uniref:DUF6986 family protein n=1 Tax=Umezawaea beigongshangensis TaxID=2780383 RepID=UPI003F683CCC